MIQTKHPILLASMSLVSLSALLDLNLPSAQAVRITPSMRARLQRQMTELTPAVAGNNPVGAQETITPTIAWDETRFNPARMVKIPSFHANTLMGFAPPALVKRYLKDKAEPFTVNLGAGDVTPVAVTVSDSIGFTGCSCPPRFNEFSITTFVKDPQWLSGTEHALGPTSMHIVPLYFSTDHLGRQRSLVTKFSMDEQFAGIPTSARGEAHIGFRYQDGKASGLYLKDTEGQIVFEAKRTVGVIGAPSLRTPFPIDNVFYNLENKTFQLDSPLSFDFFQIQGTPQPKKSFRVQGREDYQSFSPIAPPPATAFFNPVSDQLTLSRSHRATRILNELNFTPAYWHAEQLNQAIAWISVAQQ